MASKRLTPVQAAYELGVRPQIIYGYIKHARVNTFPNPAGKAPLVDVVEVERLVKGTKHRDPNREKTPSGRTMQRSPVKRGDILSWDRKPSGKTGRRIAHVSQVIRDEEGSESLVYMHDGTRELVWESATLAERLRKGYTTIEHIPALLGMIIFQLEANGDTAKAIDLREWLESRDWHYVHFVVVHEEDAPDVVPS